MPKLLPDDLLERVTNALAADSQRLGLAELQEALKGVVSRRSLQRVGSSRLLVHRPIADSSPIGYQRDFLERYAPNETEYLPENLKTQLRALGHTPDGCRPAGTYARDIQTS